MLQDCSQKWRVSNQDTEVIARNFLVSKGTVQSLLPESGNWLQASVGGDTVSGKGVVCIVCLLFFSPDTLFFIVFILKIYFSHVCYFL